MRIELKRQLPYVPAISLLGIYLENDTLYHRDIYLENATLYHRDMYNTTFTTA